MNYLLDTNILIDLLRAKKSIDSKIAKGNLYVSIITLTELYVGAYKSGNVEQSLKCIEILQKDFEIIILTLNLKTSRVYAKLRADLEKRGKRLDDFDLLIASTAINHNFTLVTNNIKHFERISDLKFTQG